MQSNSWAIGVDLGGTKIEVGLVDDKGNLEKKINCPTNVEGGPDIIQRDIINAIKELQKGLVKERLAGVGIGVAGQINPDSGDILFAPNLRWHNIPLQKNLCNALGIPVILTNDVRAATWGEWHHGAGRLCKDFLCIFVGTGIGGGIVCDGRMLCGSSNTAGEIGHITIDLNGPLCTCGNKGCMESFAGGWAITKQAQEAVKNNPKAGAYILSLANGDIQKINGKIVNKAYQSGDSLAVQILERAIQALAAGTASLVNILNPSLIVFGGGIIHGNPAILEPIINGIRQRALKSATANLEIKISHLAGEAGVVGAATMILHKMNKIKTETG